MLIILTSNSRRFVKVLFEDVRRYVLIDAKKKIFGKVPQNQQFFQIEIYLLHLGSILLMTTNRPQDQEGEKNIISR